MTLRSSCTGTAGIACLGGPHLTPEPRDYFSAVSDPTGHRGKIVPSRRDQMRPPEDRVQPFPRYWCG